MTSTPWVWHIVDWLSLPVLAIVVGILVWRKLHREFPFFFSYLLVTEIATLVRFCAQFGSARTYFLAFWISDLVIAVFSFLAVYELFLKRLFPGFYRIRIYRYLFAAVAAGIIFLGWLTAFESPKITAAFAIEERVLDFVLVAFLGFFALLMVMMGRQWTRYDFGIALGFAIYSSAFLVMSAVWTRAHYQATAIDQLTVIAYDVSSLVWLFCFWRKQQPEKGSGAATPEIVQQARAWEKVLKQWLMPKKNLF